jgi:hypothetical protein
MPASYPNSVKVFTTKTTGQTILASHINEPQDEITAIEQGLLQGLAHALFPNTDAGQDLGTATKRWRQLLAQKIASGTTNATRLRVQEVGTSTWITVNADFDGTNWNREDTTQPAQAIEINSTKEVKYYRAAAGANPITWTNIFTISTDRITASQAVIGADPGGTEVLRAQNLRAGTTTLTGTLSAPTVIVGTDPGGTETLRAQNLRAGESFIAQNLTVKGPRPWADVRAYGAVGDGVTDDGPAWNAARASLPSSGGLLLVPPGSYNLATPFTFGGQTGITVLISPGVTLSGSPLPDASGTNTYIDLRGGVLAVGRSKTTQNAGLSGEKTKGGILAEHIALGSAPLDAFASLLSDEYYLNVGQEVHGGHFVVRNTRTTPDPSPGWDFFGLVGGVVVTQWNTQDILGQMKGVVSELHFEASGTPYTVDMTFNYQAEVPTLGADVTVNNWFGMIINTPAGPGTIRTAYGINIEPITAGTLTKAAINLQGTEDAGRIKWPNVYIGQYGTRLLLELNGLELILQNPLIVTTGVTGGSAQALPSQPVGYLTVSIGNVQRKIPFYD